MNKKRGRNLNVIVLGDSQVGKTALIDRFIDNTFNGVFSTTLGVDFKTKKIVIEESQVNLQIWDTSGQERFNTITKNYYNRAMGIILIYDCTNPKTFYRIKAWMMQIENHAKNDVSKLLVAAKIDLENKIASEEGEELANQYGYKFFATSSKIGINVEEVFTFIAKEIKNKGIDQLESDKNDVIDSRRLSDSRIVKQNKCCK